MTFFSLYNLNPSRDNLYLLTTTKPKYVPTYATVDPNDCSDWSDVDEYEDEELTPTSRNRRTISSPSKENEPPDCTAKNEQLNLKRALVSESDRTGSDNDFPASSKTRKILPGEKNFAINNNLKEITHIQNLSRAANETETQNSRSEILYNDLIQQKQQSLSVKCKSTDNEDVDKDDAAEDASEVHPEDTNYEIEDDEISQSKTSHAITILLDDKNFETKIIENTLFVQYWMASFSKYLGNPVSHWGPKRMVHEYMINRPEEYSEPQMFSIFDPQDYGFLIYEVCINDVIIIKTSLDDNNMLEQLSFPEIEQKSQNPQPHTILYDVDELISFFKDRFTIGVIPFCFKQCKPVITWMRNGAIYKKGVYMFVLEDVPMPKDEEIWQCVINCSYDCENFSKKIKICKSSIDKAVKVPVIKKCEFTMDRKMLIGAGQQAKVYRGVYNNVVAAIKVISLYHSDANQVMKEIEVLRSTDNEYLTLLMAVCYEENQIFLILKYFDSVCLFDLMCGGDNELKQTYNWERNKMKIALQVCLAVAYIHEKDVVHRDLKPQNILVNESGDLRLCDFGISKFTSEQTQMQTTLNGRCVGTEVYTAPEVLVNKMAATFSSDVWSMACVIAEIFNGSSLWKISNVNMLKNLFAKAEQPNLDHTPLQIRHVIAQCFSYKPECRPPAKKVAETVKNFIENPL